MRFVHEISWNFHGVSRGISSENFGRCRFHFLDFGLEFSSHKERLHFPSHRRHYHTRQIDIGFMTQQEQNERDAQIATLPVTRVTLYKSGNAYIEHEGEVSRNKVISIIITCSNDYIDVHI